ncbi:MAG: dihydropteroate synthase [Lentisphaerae bacterium GWF2_45_14]|nr:MAG: dihydropteroate synthase [Lentisphaerae bacterium GWF2_45_14]
MGILNVTPDSFSDGAVNIDPEMAVAHALDMLANGADIIDVGGESTRPGAVDISADEEISRVIPVINRLRDKNQDCVISIDTRRSETASEAVMAGVDIINDISALSYSSDMSKIAAETGAGVVLMHMRGCPENMQSPNHLKYDNLLEEIFRFLKGAAKKAVSSGIKKDRVILDPGIGFSKDVSQNLEIVANIDCFKTLGFPLLAGPSRKSFIGKLLGIEQPEARGWGTAGVSAYMALNGLDILRVHDVKEIGQVLKVISCCMASRHREGKLS